MRKKEAHRRQDIVSHCVLPVLSIELKEIRIPYRGVKALLFSKALPLTLPFRDP